MTRARVIAMAVGNNCSVYRERGVDIGLYRTYIKIMAQEVHPIDIRVKGRRKRDAILLNPLSGWLEKRGWNWFPHQLEVLKKAQAGHDVLLCAPTGAGKTLGGFLPALTELLETKDRQKGLHTLYISPLKALTVDVHRSIGKPIEELNLPITYETRTGDTPASKRARQKTKPPDILMTTPESLALLLSYDNAGEYFANLRYIIIDELHALMHSKRGDLLSLGLARLKILSKKASIPGWDDQIVLEKVL